MDTNGTAIEYHCRTPGLILKTTHKLHAANCTPHHIGHGLRGESECCRAIRINGYRYLLASTTGSLSLTHAGYGSESRGNNLIYQIVQGILVVVAAAENV